MFESVIQRAQAGIHNAVDTMLGKVVAMVPFVIAFGFAIAALSSWLYREIGIELGNLVMAVIFAVIGLVGYAYASADGPQSLTAGEGYAETAPLSGETVETPKTGQWTDVEKEMAAALLSVAAPSAAPALLRLVLRNLPLVLAILAAVFVMTRQTEPEAASGMQAGADT